ncbi:unnamed protein product [Agarophyton chilense]|eukprot:gb/GEZJ01005937.1/.p1 GENE.gb/GEZJ01005937.1/~~gb/GEZJ01005937.1/.p1  ORF type:complete len:349 (-),score=38.17 gb/GEZJ01005937.1/:804-1850(-)
MSHLRSSRFRENHSTSIFPRRPSSCSAIITAPSPLYPIPVLPAVVFSGIALIVQNAGLFTEALFERHLLTPTTVERVSINPFCRIITARNVTLEDESHQKLLNVSELSISFPSWGKLDISSPKITLFADIHGFDLSRNNWSKHFETIAKNRQEWMAPEPAPTWLSSGKEEEVSSRNPWETTASISAIYVSISAPTSNRPLLPPIPLPPVALSSSKINTFSEVVQIVNGLIGRAVREAGTKSFPREFRESARRMARDLAVGAAEQFMVQAGAKVKKLQERVERIEEYVKDLPEGDGVRTWLGQANKFLKGVDSLLGGGAKKGPELPTPRNQEESTGSFSLDLFRELDED